MRAVNPAQAQDWTKHHDTVGALIDTCERPPTSDIAAADASATLRS